LCVVTSPSPKLRFARTGETNYWKENQQKKKEKKKKGHEQDQKEKGHFL